MPTPSYGCTYHHHTHTHTHIQTHAPTDSRTHRHTHTHAHTATFRRDKHELNTGHNTRAQPPAHLIVRTSPWASLLPRQTQSRFPTDRALLKSLLRRRKQQRLIVRLIGERRAKTAGRAFPCRGPPDFARMPLLRRPAFGHQSHVLRKPPAGYQHRAIERTCQAQRSEVT